MTAVICGAALLQQQNGSYLPLRVLWAYTVGFVVTLPLIPVGLLAAKLCQQWADRCERSADLMEPTKRRHSR